MTNALVSLSFISLRSTVPPADHTTNPVAQDTAVSFSRDIFPILERSCVQCHGGRGEDGRLVAEEGLDMTTYEGLRAGSVSGTVVEPGDADASYLIELVEAGDMPQEGDALSPDEVQLIRRWIAAGALNN